MSSACEYNDTSHAERLEAYLSTKRKEDELSDELRCNIRGPAMVAVVYDGKPVSSDKSLTRAVRPTDYTHPQSFLSSITCKEISALPTFTCPDEQPRLMRVATVSWNGNVNMPMGNHFSEVAVEASSRPTPVSLSKDLNQLSVDLSDDFLNADLDTFTASHINAPGASLPLMQVASVDFARGRSALRGRPDHTSPRPIAEHLHTVIHRGRSSSLPLNYDERRQFDKTSRTATTSGLQEFAVDTMHKFGIQLKQYGYEERQFSYHDACRELYMFDARREGDTLLTKHNTEMLRDYVIFTCHFDVTRNFIEIAVLRRQTVTSFGSLPWSEEALQAQQVESQKLGDARKPQKARLPRRGYAIERANMKLAKNKALPPTTHDDIAAREA